MKTEFKKATCNHPHYCYEWDSMFITPLMPEFQACVCECDGAVYTDQDWRNLYIKRWADEDKKVLKEYLISIGKGELAMT